MTGTFAAAVRTEARKLAASRVVWSTTLLVVVGIAVLTGAMAAAADAGNEQILDQLGDLSDDDGWTRLVGIAIMISAAASLLGYGVVMAWTVGREFADGTINGLFALPVSRTEIAIAKLVLVGAWTVIVAVSLVVVVVGTGMVLGYGFPDGEAARDLVRLLVLAVLTGALAVPAAWAATLGRGLLPGIAVTVGIVASAQVAVVAGSGAWYPAAAPALWAIEPDNVSPAQLALVPLVTVVVAFLTARAWARLELDR